MMRKSVDLDIKGIERWLGIESWKIEKAIAFAMLESVAYGTPVDTGRARASWGMNTSAPRDYDPGPQYKASARAAAGRAMRNNGNVGDNPPGVKLPPIILSNYVEYIEPLDNGHSAQGAHFVDRAIAEGEAIAP